MPEAFLPLPSPVPQRVLRALASPTLGHLDPQFLAILDETCELLRQVFRTKDPVTFPLSSTGMAGMECVATNLIEPPPTPFSAPCEARTSSPIPSLI